MELYSKYLDKLENIENKIAIVTGANSGLGLETTIALVYKNVHVIMACRNLEKAKKAKEHVLSIVSKANIDILEYDQSNFESIDKFVDQVETKYDHIDFLVCNAGVYYPKKDYKTVDGFELTFGTNYLGVYHLLDRINESLEKWHSKVVLVTSLTGVLSKRTYSIKDSNHLGRNKVYSFSKYCLSRLCFELQKNSTNVEYYLTHPGITHTNIVSAEQTGFPNWFSKLGHDFMYVFTHSPAKACLTTLVALTMNSNKKYVKPRGLFRISGYPVKTNFPKYSKKPIIQETKDYLASFNYR